MSNFLVGNVPYSPAWTDHGTGGGTSYTLPNSGTVAATLVFVGGAIQEPGVDFTIAGTALTMTTSVTSGIGVISCQLYALGTINVPADDSVTAAKLDLSMTEGDLIYGTGADTWTKLAKGTASQQLAMNGGATAPEWVTVAGGGAWNLIGTAEASSSSTLDITGIDATYDTYFLAGNALETDAAESVGWIRLGDSGGVDSGASDYGWVSEDIGLHANGTSASVTAPVYGQDNADAQIEMMGQSEEVGTSANEAMSFTAYLTNLRASTAFPTIHGSCQWLTHSTPHPAFNRFGGMRRSAITTDRVQFRWDTGTIVTGRITLWGIAHA